MKINDFSIKNYRNIEDIYFEPFDGVNIIYGENAQGKTNLLESIWLFTGCRSFRGSKEDAVKTVLSLAEKQLISKGLL